MRQWLGLLIFAGFFSSICYASDLLLPATRPLDIPNVEVLARNPRIGPSLVAKISFVRWLEFQNQELQLSTTIGLTKSGALYQVATVKDRRLARRLSGIESIEDFVMTNDGDLLAVDAHQNIFFFNPEKWSRSPKRQLIRNGIAWWASLTLGFGLFSGQIQPDLLDRLPEVRLLMIGLFSGTTALNTAFFQLNRFDMDNQNPSGLEKINVTLGEGENLQTQWTRFQMRLPFRLAAADWSPPCEATLLPLPPESAILRRHIE